MVDEIKFYPLFLQFSYNNYWYKQMIKRGKYEY